MPTVVRQRLAHEPKHLLNGEPEIIGQAPIGALVRFPMLEDQGQGYVARYFEKYVRAPGCRVIAVKDDKIYLQKEYRFEQDAWDWRLPGGKVIDTFEHYRPYMLKEVPDVVVLEAATRELQEEAKLSAREFTLFVKMICGTTVEWDLYYVVARGVEETEELNPDRADGEDVANAAWCTFDEVRTMCEKGEISEGRTVAALIRFMAQ